MEMSARDGRKLRQETAVEGRKGGIITSTSTDEHKYPTSSTIPFPFASGPYACQAALMDAMLDTLKLVDENDECDHDPVVGTTRKEHKANIMMLESPTGTGKSLSLACASLAWLKYREQCDLNALTQPSKEDKLLADTGNKISTKVDSSSASARPNNKNKPDWLYDWTPPDQVAKEQEKKRQTKACLERAASARGALEKDLNSIRKQLKHQRLLDGYAYAASSSSNIGKQELIRKAREHIVKKAMIDARSKGRIKGCSIRRKSDVSVGKKRPRTTNNEDEDDSMYCLSAYHSDDENTNNKKFDYNSSDDDDTNSVKDGEGKQRFKSKVASLINGGNLDGSGENKLKYQHQVNKINSRSDDVDAMTVGGVTPGSGIRKIVYAARTHSQLSQFVGEIKRTKWGKANDVRVIALGGRRLLCGNREVTESRSGGRKRSEAIITEKCLDIQKSSKLSCPLLTKDDYAIPTLSMHMLAEPSDIEDLAGLGEASKTCSYYASRESIKAAEVVVVPYNTLLSKSARDAVGLSLKKSLVIIDESHNIPEALRSLSSCTMTASAIDGAMIQLTNYVKKYSSRLAGRNIFYLGQIRRFLTSSAKYLRSGRNRNSGVKMNKEMVTATDLLFTLKLDNLNLFNILRYLERSGLSQKLHGFTNASAEYKSIEVDTSPNFVSKHISQMSVVETFLRCLTSSQQEGRVIIEIPEEGANKVDTGSRDSVQSIANFRYLLLDPSTEFKNIRQEAHAIVLAGGTLRPFTHIATELLGSDKELVKKTNEVEKSISCSNDNTAQSAISMLLTTFTCGHVVPAQNVLMTCLSKGPSGVKLDFRHSSRCLDSTCRELGETVIKVIEEIPHGMVIFLPSYSYEAFLINKWKSTGIFKRILEKKKIFREPKSAKDVESTLQLYSKKASSAQGALMFCVVGGKMSEGINFANEMARGVMIVGLPYADITDIVLKTKMNLLDKEFQEERASISGSDYYQNLCMRNVNQSIGRAIRHANDYAAIILVDRRYESDPRVWRDLPAWLREGRKKSEGTFAGCKRSIKMFFNSFVN
uniref:Helicase ATP-binding domain-containing protein n=1 Tax=Chaetoceros debilis TaxID=122233 RepID=A0A7S3QEP4_9STRA